MDCWERALTNALAAEEWGWQEGEVEADAGCSQLWTPSLLPAYPLPVINDETNRCGRYLHTDSCQQ